MVKCTKKKTCDLQDPSFCKICPCNQEVAERWANEIARKKVRHKQRSVVQ